MMATFQCKKCKFKFNPKGDTNVLPTRCGYCGAQGSVVRQMPADDLIRNVDDLLGM